MSEINYRTLRRRVILRWLNRILFAAHLLLFLSYWAPRPPFIVPLYTNILMFWFLVLVAHFLWAFNIVGSFIQRQTDREAEHLRARGYTVIAPEHDRTLAGGEKPKRAARLSDDGEIEFDDEPRELDEVNAARTQRTE